MGDFKIKIYEIKSNEEIDKNYIDKFLLTNLSHENITFNKKSKIYYSFIESLQLYQVLVFEKIPNMFFYKTSIENQLFIHKDFVSVYKDRKLYYYQKIDNLKNIEELKSFLEKTLSLDNLKVIEKDKIVQNRKNELHEFIKPVRSNLFKFFLAYLFVLCLGFYFFEFDKKEDYRQLDTIKSDTLLLKNSMVFEHISDDIFSLYKNAQDNKLKILSVNFKNSKFVLNLKSKEKENIYIFLKDLKGSVENMTFDKNSKEYIANASFKIHRR